MAGPSLLVAVMFLWRVVGVLLAVPFAWAAAAKAIALDATRRDFAELGVRRPDIAVPLVCVAEAVTAFLLVLRPRAGAMVALFLLTAFSGVLVSVIRSGREVRCACFGAVSRRPVDVRDLVRNGALAALAVTLMLAT